MKIRNENTTITALIITVLIYVGLFTIIPILTSKLSLSDQLKVFLKASIESTIKSDIKLIMQASSQAESLDCSKLQPFLKSKCTQASSISLISSTEYAGLVSYTIQRHFGLYAKDTYDVAIRIVENSKKIDSIYSSLEGLFITPPKHVNNSYSNIDEVHAKQPVMKYQKSAGYPNTNQIYLINIKYSDLKVSN